eukprot:scpid32442/ scgid26159/ 
MLVATVIVERVSFQASRVTVTQTPFLKTGGLPRRTLDTLVDELSTCQRKPLLSAPLANGSFPTQCNVRRHSKCCAYFQATPASTNDLCMCPGLDQGHSNPERNTNVCGIQL